MLKRNMGHKVAPYPDPIEEMEEIMYPIVIQSTGGTAVRCEDLPVQSQTPSKPNLSREDIMDLIDFAEQIRIPTTPFEQKTVNIQSDDTVQDDNTPAYEVISFPYTHTTMPKITTFVIRSSGTTITVSNDRVVASKPVLIDLVSDNRILRMWDAVYTEVRAMRMDGTSVVTGYSVHDFDENKQVVKDRVLPTQFPINLDLCTTIDFQGDQTDLVFDPSLFDGKDCHIKARGYSTVNLGGSKFTNLTKDVNLCRIVD